MTSSLASIMAGQCRSFLARLRASTCLLAGCGMLLALPAMGQERAWIPSAWDGTISAIDGDTGSAVAVVSVGASPVGVAAAASGDVVYISNNGSDTVSVIDTATATVTATLPVGDQPFGLAPSPDGSRLYVVNNGGDSVSIIDTASSTTIQTVGVGSTPFGIAVTPDGKWVYVTNQSSPFLSVIDTTTFAVSTIAADSSLTAIVSSPDGSRMYVGNSGGNDILVIDTGTQRIVDQFTILMVSYDLAISPDGTLLYATDVASRQMAAINTESGALIGSTSVGDFPYGIDVTPDGSRIYVADLGSNNVLVIDAASLSVTDTIGVPLLPYAFGNFISGSASPPPPPTGVDLSASPAAPLVYAAEILASPDTPVALDNSTGLANLTTPLGYNFSPDEVRYARIECTGGLVFADDSAVTYVGAGGATVGAINGLNSSAIHFSVTGTASADDLLTVTGGRRITGTDPVTCTYGVYDFPSQAAHGGPHGRVATMSGAYLDFAPSTTFTANAREATADVEADPAFGAFVPEGATTPTTAALADLHMGLSGDAPLKADGTPIALADLHATGPDGTRFVVDGDFSAAANDDGSFTDAALDRVYLSANDAGCTFSGGIPASALSATQAVFPIGGWATDRMLCLAPAAGTPIPAADYSAGLVAVSAAPATYAPGDLGPLDAGRITRNGTELQAPLVQLPAGWLSRLVLTNTGNTDRQYAIAASGEPGNAIDTGQLTGTVPANGTVVIDLAEVLTGFSGQPRATLNVTVAGPKDQIQGLYQIVNPTAGTLSNQVLVRPASN